MVRHVALLLSWWRKGEARGSVRIVFQRSGHRSGRLAGYRWTILGRLR
jgi:hypothetical protein